MKLDKLRWIWFSFSLITTLLTSLSTSLVAQVTYPGSGRSAGLASPNPLWRIDVSGGYQFGGAINVNGGRLRITDGFSWSGALSYEWTAHNRFTLTYVTQATELRLNAYSPFDGTTGDRRLTDMRMHYILLGSLQEFAIPGPVQPFAGGQAGVVLFDPQDPRFRNETRFAVSLTGGVRGPIAGPFGWKAQATLLMPILWMGGGLFCSTGGCNIGISSRTVIPQLNASAGLTVSF